MATNPPPAPMDDRQRAYLVLTEAEGFLQSILMVGASPSPSQILRILAKIDETKKAIELHLESLNTPPDAKL